MKKQIIIAVLLVSVLCVLSACGSNAKNNGESVNSANISENTEKIAVTAEELESFNTSFFNQTDDISIPNMFLASEYSSAENIDLYILFYGGVSRQQNESITDAEKEAVTAALNSDEQFDLIKVTAAQMNDTLKKYTGLTLDETQKKNLDKFVYLEDYDAYYLAHTDTYMDYYTFTEGYKTTDGTVTLLYSSRTLDPAGQYTVTLKEADDGYLFVSNLPN